MKPTKFVSVIDSLVSITLMAVIFMWLMPFGRFDLLTPGFYLCILLAGALEISIRWVLRHIQKDPDAAHGQLSRSISRVQWITLMSLIFMWLMPYGTFQPTQIGFYICIGLAVFIEYSTLAVLRRIQSPPPAE